MSGARNTMRHRCTIERKARTTDAGGHQVETWTAHLAALPCRAWFESSRISLDGDKPATIDSRCVIVPLGSDVIDSDRISQITDRLGAVLFAGPMPIASVARRADHIQVYVREIT